MTMSGSSPAPLNLHCLQWNSGGAAALNRSLNEGDLREDNILEAWNSTTKLSSNSVSAPSKCLNFIEPSIRPLIASCMLKASREDWLRINLARRILLVKAKKNVVNSYSDLSYCHPFNGLLY
ncbi:hypothetical protein ACOME3_002967 [Neoechinorhynchus agilis]